MRPNDPGYNLTIADLQRARLSPEEIARVLFRSTGGDPMAGVSPQVGADPVIALLAQMALTQATRNALYAPFPWSLGTWYRQQILNDNPQRNYLLIQNVGGGDLMIVFEGAKSSPEDMTSSAGQTELITQQTRAIRIVAGGSYEPNPVPPRNAISIFTIGTATNGIVIEGA